MDKGIFTLGFLSILLIGCQQNAGNYSKSVETDKDFETTTFTYIPGKDLNRVPLCEVKYYVENGVLYSSERYHALYLVYSNDSTNRMSYQYSILFDTKQEVDSAGWYSLDLKDVDIPRIPCTHLSGIIMRNYYGNLLPDPVMYVGWPDAVLYNTCPQIAHGQVRTVITPEIEKLLPLIK